MRKILRAWGRELLGIGSAPRVLPWLALLVTVVIWASYLVFTRLAVTSTLNPVDIGLLRSGTAVIFFLPIILKHGLFPSGANWLDILAIAGFGGTIFIFFLATGLTLAPVADSGVFAPSMLPVLVAILSVIFLAQRYTRIQLAGLALIVGGALAIGGAAAIAASEGDTWKGHLLFLGASLCWAIYTVRFRVSGLPALHGAAILVFWSSLAFLAIAPFTGLNLWTAPRDIVLLQASQGFLAGAVANLTFLYAINTLGAPVAAASAALVPVLAALGGWMFLGEPIGPLKATGILVVAAGIALASGLVTSKSAHPTA